MNRDMRRARPPFRAWGEVKQAREDESSESVITMRTS